MAEMSVRYTYRLRVSRTAEALLLAEWDRDRWVWNECVARSRALRRAGETCGPARLDKDLTKARSVNGWLAEGSSVPQQQTIRDFGAARAVAIKDISNRLPMKQRRGFPRFKKKALARPSMNYTRNGFSSPTAGSAWPAVSTSGLSGRGTFPRFRPAFGCRETPPASGGPRRGEDSRR